jgi:hypothetical protein
MQLLLRIGVFLALATVAIFLLQHSPELPESAPDQVEPAQAADLDSTASFVPHLDPVLRAARDNTTDRLIRVLDDSNDQPIASAWLRSVGETAPTIVTAAGYPRSTDAIRTLDGTLQPSQLIRSIQGSSHWAVEAEGYEAQVHTDLVGGEVIRLRRAHAFRLEVRHEDGDPAIDTKIWLYPAGAWMRFQAGVFPGPGIGDPRSDAPTWTGLTDGNGVWTARSLPAGTYRLRVENRFGFPVRDSGRGEQDVVVPGDLHLDLCDFFAAVFAAPPGRSIVSHAFTIPTNLDRDPGLLRFRSQSLAGLAKAFPNTIAWVGRPMGGQRGEEAMIAVKAMLDGRLAAVGNWPLVPIRSIEEPAILEILAEVLYRNVTLQVLDPASQPLTMGLKVSEVSSRGLRVEEVDCQSGASIHLPPGKYRVQPSQPTPWVQWTQDGRFEIAETSPPELIWRLQLEQSLTVVKMTPQFKAPQRGPVHFGIFSGDLNFGVVNWDATRGPIEILLPSGRARVQMQALHHHMDTREFEVMSGVPKLELVLEIKDQ